MDYLKVIDMRCFFVDFWKLLIWKKFLKPKNIWKFEFFFQNFADVPYVYT